MITALLLLQAGSMNLSVMPSGLFHRIGGYRPLGVKVSDVKPASITKVPDGPLRYGSITVAGKTFVIAVSADRFYADTNNDGDLTDDPATEWVSKTYSGSDKASYSGTFSLDVPIQGKTVRCAFGFYQTPDANDYGAYADFALTGKIMLGAQSYDVIYSDETGAFDGTKGMLLIDKDRDGKFHPGYEFYPVEKPFNIAGTTYELHQGLTIVKSATTVAERTAASVAEEDPNLANGLRAGKSSLPFTAKTMAGTSVSLPKSFKGKVVLLDFWATWCGPCMREVPNVVKNYTAYHGKGLEVLGITLDKENATEQIQKVTAKQGMVWDQVYDGKFFDAAIAKQYGIRSIPATYLIDGDTGKILASGYGARGEKLGPAIEKALKAKSSSR